ncbi:MAG: hypothetical protein AAF804_09170 [Bacteroidota bacterium]
MLLFLNGMAQEPCDFSHSKWGSIDLVAPTQMKAISWFYPGEYLEVYLRAEQCYQIVLIDTAAQDLQVAVWDSAGRAMAHFLKPSTSAETIHWYAAEDATHLISLSSVSCGRGWIPITLLVEWTPPGTPFTGAGRRINRKEYP